MSTTITVDKLMFGGAGIAGCYHPVPRQQALATLQRAQQLGITAYDTAPLYGAGLSEDYYRHLHLNNKVYTKVGRITRRKDQLTPNTPHVMWDYTDLFKLDSPQATLPENIQRYPVYEYSPIGINYSMAQSKERMQRAIQGIRLHDAETEQYYNWAIREKAVETMVELKEHRLTKEIGLGMNNPDYILRFLRKYPVGTFDNVMMAGCWTLLDQSGRQVLEECQRQGIKVHQAGIFGGGLLWGLKYYKYKIADQAILDKVARWEEVCNKHGVCLPAVAMAFSFKPQCVEYLCVGAQSPEQIEQIVDVSKQEIPEQLWQDAVEQGLLEKDFVHEN